MSTWGLALDFGSTFSTAATVTDGRVAVIDVFGSSRVPSVVLFDEDGDLVVGTTAQNAAVMTPERVERSPKRAVGNRMVLLGGEAILVVDVVAALLTVLVDEAVRQHGGELPDRTVLTHPARWGLERLAVLVDAAVKAGLDRATIELVPEPVAAAALYTKARALDGDAVAVYDLGGGTFDTAVLRQTTAGFEVVGVPEGDETVGGEAFDHLLYRKVGEHLAAADAGLWVDLTTSPERRWRRANADLLAQVRQAKEQLSTTERASVYVPMADRSISITRSEFEALVADDIQRTAELLARTVDGAGLGTGELAAVYLVGGSSRIPLIGRRLTDLFSGRLSTWDDPQLAVVLGAAELLRTDTQLPTSQPTADVNATTTTSEAGAEATTEAGAERPADSVVVAVGREAATSDNGPAGHDEPQVVAVFPQSEAPDPIDGEDDRRVDAWWKRRATIIGGAVALSAIVAVAALTTRGNEGGIGAQQSTIPSTTPATTSTSAPTPDPVDVVGSPQWEAMIRGLSLCEAIDRDDIPRFVRSNSDAEACAAGAAGADALSLCEAIYDDGELRATDNGPTSAAIVDGCPEPVVPDPDAPAVGSDEWAAEIRTLDLCAALARDDISDLWQERSMASAFDSIRLCALQGEATKEPFCEWLADQVDVPELLTEACAEGDTSPAPDPTSEVETPGVEGPTGPGGAPSG